MKLLIAIGLLFAFVGAKSQTVIDTVNYSFQIKSNEIDGYEKVYEWKLSKGGILRRKIGVSKWDTLATSSYPFRFPMGEHSNILLVIHYETEDGGYSYQVLYSYELKRIAAVLRRKWDSDEMSYYDCL